MYLGETHRKHRALPACWKGLSCPASSFTVILGPLYQLPKPFWRQAGPSHSNTVSLSWNRFQSLILFCFGDISFARASCSYWEGGWVYGTKDVTCFSLEWEDVNLWELLKPASSHMWTCSRHKRDEHRPWGEALAAGRLWTKGGDGAWGHAWPSSTL